MFGELFIFKLIFKDIYLSNLIIFYILLLPPLFSGINTLILPFYYYQKDTRLIFFSSLISWIFNIGTTLILIIYFKEIGAAVAALITSVFNTLAYILIFRKKVNLPGYVIKWTLFLSLASFIAVISLIKFSLILFLMILILTAIISFRAGNLFQKRTILFNFLKNV